MTVAVATADPDEPARGAPWRFRAGAPLACGGDHGSGPGRLDESARRLPHQEYRVAQQLVAEGHSVISVAETPGRGRQADLAACGSGVEVKSWLAMGAGRDRAPNARSVVNKLLQADGQAATVVLNAEGSGLSARQARAGMFEYISRPRPSGVRNVRVLGDGFDLTWSRDPAIRKDRAAERGRDLGVGR